MLLQLKLKIDRVQTLKMQFNFTEISFPTRSDDNGDALIEQVLRLSLEQANSITYSQANGLAHEYRKLIKTMRMSRSSQKCSICIEGFKVDERIKRLPCGHIYHNQCAKAWLKVNKRCPLCRLDLEQYFNSHGGQTDYKRISS